MRAAVISIILLAATAVLVVFGVRTYRGNHHHHVTASTAFRKYLADPSAQMVAYSPDADPAADPQGRMVREQLARLRTKFDGISLYGCTPQTPGIVEAARDLGYRAVLLTVWDPRSESELATVSSVLRDEAGKMALAVSIGSEGLMEKRYTLADMQSARDELLERNTAVAAVEMATTEPWWLYLRDDSAGLRGFGEFTSVNIHVVWDTDIVDPALAASWTRDRADEVQKVIGHPLLLREAGLPGGGSSPRDSVKVQFTRTMQRDFWQQWFALPHKPPVVAFEGIDNTGKHWRDFEGSWGLLSPELHPWPAWEAFPLRPEGSRP